MSTSIHTAIVWDVDHVRDLFEAAFTKALAEDRLRRRGSARRARREALRRPGAAPQVHRLAPTPTVELDGWYSDAPKATGEVQDLLPDEPGDDELREAARWLQLNPEPQSDPDEWVEWIKRFERLFSVSLSDADAVALRTVDEIRSDEDVAEYVTRDSAKAPRGFGMTSTEERRAWMMNTRYRYADMLRQAVAKHRGRISSAKANEFPALKAEAQFARSVQARWAFVDELERHGVWKPETELVRTLKIALGGTFERAFETLRERRHAAEAGRTDRYRHELV